MIRGFFFVLLVSVAFGATATFFSSGTPNSQPLKVSNFQPNRQTPGNVGLALSGGGAIQLSNVMGILRALRHLGLDTKIKAISSGSGGTWGSAPYTFLPDSISDDEFLGPMVTDYSKLTLTSLFNDDTATDLSYMGPNQLGKVPSQLSFEFGVLAARAAVLYAQGVPYYRLWDRMIGESVLMPFGISGFDETTNCPTHTFCGDKANCDSILAANPGLKVTPMREGRPYHIMNTAMFVNTPQQAPGATFEYLVPVQSTPWNTGILSSPNATYLVDGVPTPVGGGMVQSFAFSSIVESVNGNTVTVTPKDGCYFGISDIAGASSAAFAELIRNEMHSLIKIDPQFSYWPVNNMQPGAGSMVRFSDAGTLENNGVAAMLAYEDIENIISVAYVVVDITMDDDGIIVLDGSYPSLFGFQQYKKGVGYVPFPPLDQEMPNELSTEFRHNQVFDSSQWQEVLDGLYAATTNNGQSPPGTGSPVFLMKNLRVVDNEWFGVKGGRTVNMLIVYMSPASDFNNQLAWEVQDYLSVTHPHFPMLQFLAVHHGPTTVNLLAHFASWMIYSNRDVVSSMFEPTPSQIQQEAFLADANNNIVNNSDDVERKRIIAVSIVGVVFLIVAAAFLVYRRKKLQQQQRLVDEDLEAAAAAHHSHAHGHGSYALSNLSYEKVLSTPRDRDEE